MIKIIGGTFDSDGGKPSSVINKLASFLNCNNVVNGGMPEQLNNCSCSGHNLVLWMPNVSNELEKTYPVKDTGAVLICSKVMREGYTRFDAIARIFKMHGNAVIMITSEQNKFCFELVDALGNTWVRTDSLDKLSVAITVFYDWSIKQVRYASKRVEESDTVAFENTEFLKLVTKIADKIEQAKIGRFFGNCSTRCFKTFPSMKSSDFVWVSARNVDKKRITSEEMVRAWLTEKTVNYTGNKKPSVDTATQLLLYNALPNINYMVHGHAFFNECHATKEYYPCGDTREADEILKIFDKEIGFGQINLTNHGFLIFGNTIEQIEHAIESSMFV